MKRNIQQKAGFTLIEMVIAIAIISLVIVVVYEALFIGMQTCEKQENARYFNQDIRKSWSQISRDIRCAVIPETIENFIFLGKHEKYESIDVDSLKFITYMPQYYSKFGGLCIVKYCIDKEQGLVREIYNYPLRNSDDKCIEKREICRAVKSLKLEYDDGTNWITEWDNKKMNDLPCKVRLTLKISENDREKSIKIFTTIIPVFSSEIKHVVK